MSFLLPGLTACSTLGLNAPWDKEPRPDYDLIAENLVNSLAQFPHLNPLMATVQVAPPRSRFERQIESELRERGYKVERVAGHEGLNRVTPEIRQINSEEGEQDLYVLSVGQLSVERQYDVVADKTVPTSEQIIRGTRERAINLDDDIFDVPDSEYSAVAFKPYDGPGIDDVLAPPETGALDWFNREEPRVIKQNIYETMASNYRELFAGYEDVDQSILVFPNDSLRLGDVNKSIIERYVAEMDPDTDVLSVIGCSHGDTRISNGNSLLALGRANRVKEALLFSGLEHDRILEEGCWAPQLFDEVMPRRGVVLTLKRQKQS
ncbi:hypothetical protein ACUNV4_18615 [Granulosicoccus sp. 3-233]|uniref:hypothetical protein n=1 Tax=Granulosicoccus sp. 3-233 TaxID=3417969 RepID=UPI003D3552A3